MFTKKEEDEQPDSQKNWKGLLKYKWMYFELLRSGYWLKFGNYTVSSKILRERKLIILYRKCCHVCA